MRTTISRIADFARVRPIMIPGFFTPRRDKTSTMRLDESSPKITRPGDENVNSGLSIAIPFLPEISASTGLGFSGGRFFDPDGFSITERGSAAKALHEQAIPFIFARKLKRL